MILQIQLNTCYQITMVNCEVFPLFSSPVAVFNIEEDLSNLETVKKSYSFKQTNSPGSSGSEVTEKMNLLDDFPVEKNILLEYFNVYKDEFLHLETTSFRITTSWGTKVTKDSFSQFHNHRNSIYSSVFYLDADVNSATIEFDSENIFPQEIMLNKPSEWNVYNSRSWFIKPEKNMLIIFPSYLRHRIGQHKSNTPRYSIAFNLFPNCLIGTGDSSLELTK
jgi:uncharacterized protein (TIGR02466 family)